MIHFHGTPISGSVYTILPFFEGRNFLISMEHPSQSKTVTKYSSKFILDNGAYSHWRKGRGTIDILKYKDFVESYDTMPNYTWNFIPDIIDGTEADNDSFVDKWLSMYGKENSVPVFHYHESLSRLQHLAEEFPIVALGSSSEYSQIGTPKWMERTEKIFEYYLTYFPTCKLHGLRMLNKKIFTKFHYYSGDSTNVGRNIEFYRDRHNIQKRLEAATRLAESIEYHKSLYNYSILHQLKN